MNSNAFLNWADGMGLSTSQFRVLCAVKCFQMFQENFPSIKELEMHCRMHEDTISDSLKYLVKIGVIKKQTRIGFSNVYSIIPPTK